MSAQRDFAFKLDGVTTTIHTLASGLVTCARGVDVLKASACTIHPDGYARYIARHVDRINRRRIPCPQDKAKKEAWYLTKPGILELLKSIKTDKANAMRRAIVAQWQALPGSEDEKFSGPASASDDIEDVNTDVLRVPDTTTTTTATTTITTSSDTTLTTTSDSKHGLVVYDSSAIAEQFAAIQRVLRDEQLKRQEMEKKIQNEAFKRQEMEKKIRQEEQLKREEMEERMTAEEGAKREEMEKRVKAEESAKREEMEKRMNEEEERKRATLERRIEAEECVRQADAFKRMLLEEKVELSEAGLGEQFGRIKSYVDVRIDRRLMEYGETHAGILRQNRRISAEYVDALFETFERKATIRLYEQNSLLLSELVKTVMSTVKTYLAALGVQVPPSPPPPPPEPSIDDTDIEGTGRTRWRRRLKRKALSDEKKKEGEEETPAAAAADETAKAKEEEYDDEDTDTDTDIESEQTAPISSSAVFNTGLYFADHIKRQK